MQREITGYTKDQYKFHTMALVGFLVNAVQKGASGAWPLDYDGVSGQVIGQNGNVFDIEIMVKQVELGAGHVYVIEPNKIWSEYSNSDGLHAVFA